MVSYFQPVTSANGIKYSCDMVRFSFTISKRLFDSFRNAFNSLQYNPLWQFECTWFLSSAKIGSYRDLFSCCKKFYDDVTGKIIKNFSFTVGLGLFESSNSMRFKCFLEFNPNKADMEFMKRLMLFFVRYMPGRSSDKYFELTRWDLAIDIPVERSKCFLVKNGKRQYTKTISNSVTEYIGKHNTSGFAKLYDKTVESKLDYDLTRLEITLDSLTEYKLPECYVINHDAYTDEGLNDTDKVLLKLIRGLTSDEQIQVLREMGRGKAKKLKPYIFPIDCKFEYNMSAIYLVADAVDQMQYVWREVSHLFEFVEDFENEENVKDDEIFEQCTLFSE